MLFQNDDEQLKRLVEQIPKVADGTMGISEEETAFARKIRPFGRKALPFLLPSLTGGTGPVR